MTSIRQSSFSRGEITPDLYGRIDQQIYSLSLHTARNFVPGRFGQIDNRPGSQFSGQVANSANQVRIIPFVFSQTQSYVLEFGNMYFRVWKSGAQVTNATQVISAISVGSSPCTLTVTAHGYTTGQEVTLAGITTIPQLNGRNVIVGTTTTNTFVIQDNITLTNIDSTSFPAYTSGGTVASIYSVTTPYVTGDLQTINFAQSADTLSLVHPTYPPADVARLADNNWTYTTTVFQPSLSGPTVTFSTASGATGTSTYQVTAVNSATGEESLPGLGTPLTVGTFTESTSSPAAKITITSHGLTSGNSVFLANTGTTSQNITGISLANPTVTWTVTSHGYSNGDTVMVNGIGPLVLPLLALNVNPNGQNWTVANVTTNTFTLTGITTTATGTLTGGIYGTTSEPYFAAFANQNWIVTVIDANNFSLNGAIGTVNAVSSGGTKGTVTTNSVSHAASGSPSAAAPNILTWTSVAGAGSYNVYVLLNGIFCWIGATAQLTFSDTGITPVVTQNPPIPGNPFGSPGNYPSVVGYYQQRRLYAGTNNSATTGWLSVPGSFANFSTHSPTVPKDSIQFTLASLELNAIRGIADLRILVVFTQGGEWSLESVSGAGIDATTGLDVRQSSYNGSSQLRPLIVNANGIYVQAQSSVVRDIIWSFQSDNFTGEERSLYSNHLVQGFTLQDWAYQKVPYSIVWAVRSDGELLSYTYLREQEVFGWSHHDWLSSVTVSGNTVTISSAVVENVCAVPEGGETALYLVINRTMNGRTVRYIERLQSRLVQNLVDCAYMDAHLTYDGRSGNTTTNKVYGLWHLIGQSVSVFADNNVIANPLNPNYPVLTVAADGSLTLPAAYQVIHIGLPYTSDLVTNDPEIIESETLLNKRMAINSVSLFLKQSLGGWVGRGDVTPADTSQADLAQVNVVDSDDNPPAPGTVFTGKVTTPIEASYDRLGRILVRQIDPQPFTVLSLSINGDFPTRQKGT